jgi:abnormal spindle-like microcephaly-associated protein
MYDEKWAEKQVATLVQWVNFKFSSLEVNLPINESTLEQATPLQQSTTPISQPFQNNNFSASTLLRHRQDISRAMDSELVTEALRLIEREIVMDHIKVRMDQNIRANVALKEDFINLLLSYDLYWLKLGLETVLRTNIPSPYTNPNKSTDPKAKDRVHGMWSSALKKIILSSILACPDIYEMHCKPGVVLTTSAECRYTEDLNRHLLRCVFTLIICLDYARMNNYCDGRSLLFNKSSTIKSTKDILITFCRKFLRSEANIIKHLSTLGYTPQFTQTIFHEFPFPISNVSVDLRDGVRLCQLINVLLATTGDRERIDTTLLRIPAGSRLQKMYNVGLALKFLANRGIASSIEDKQIVDGDRVSTLHLLWCVLMEFDLKCIVHPAQIVAEGNRIVASHNLDITENSGKKAYNHTTPPSPPPAFPSSLLSSHLPPSTFSCIFYSYFYTIY